ncbi:hypothetical protein RT717_06935 [Imperialibacter roseus]|uniref:Apea-like HEPN domain-containing protein n=1 Tax=Imperialibacter roseus TaxID=1324217 RepID=A0ABZ0ITL5_9BACT|nr:hypothetical protein [Imperialibacter roseus]WOK08372.1 hypothetical protein RT717_06935 [Imperialibacter roseus]
MKHIKRRFLYQELPKINLNQPGIEYLTLRDDLVFESAFLKEKKGTPMFLETDQGEYFPGFLHTVDGKHVVLPIPDPSLIYFNNAQLSVAKIKNLKKTLLEKIEFSGKPIDPPIHEIYNYYGLTTGFLIFLFTSLESFTNQIIPDKYTFRKIVRAETRTFSKSDIQKAIDFKTKVTEILPECTGKSFFSRPTPTNNLIWNLRDFRDDIIHTKQEPDFLKYSGIIKKTLNFKYQKTLEAVASFMNFYKPGYIVECGCGRDF